MYQSRMMGHFARFYRMKAWARGKAETEARDMPKANLEDPREDIQENRKVGDTKDSAGRASDTSHQNVDGESPTSMRKMQTAENQRAT